MALIGLLVTLVLSANAVFTIIGGMGGLIIILLERGHDRAVIPVVVALVTHVLVTLAAFCYSNDFSWNFFILPAYTVVSFVLLYCWYHITTKR